jgi:hypothetical protein
MVWKDEMEVYTLTNMNHPPAGVTFSVNMGRLHKLAPLKTKIGTAVLWTMQTEWPTVFLCSCVLTSSRLFLSWPILGLWKWRRHAGPKRRLTFNGIHDVIYQKIKVFVTTAVITSIP